MPNRYVREGIIESERVNSLSWAAEVFYRRLINRVDDFGRFTAHIELLRAHIYPLQLQKVKSQDVAKMLSECEAAGLVSTWESESGKRFLALHTWEKGRAIKSLYPDPPHGLMSAHVYICKRMQTDVPDPDPDPDYDPDSVPDPDTGAKALSVCADEIFNAYPKKVGKPAALKSILKALSGFPPEMVLQKTKEYAASREGQDSQYTPHPATWFNQQRFNDLPETWKAHNGNNSNPNKPSIDRNAGTANEGQSAQYEGVGRLPGIQYGSR